VVVVEALVVEQQIEAVSGVDFRSAAEAATRFDGYTEHPFPTCFGCGLERPQHDGLALYAGKVDGRESARVATPFVPREGTGPDRVLIWAALDCPGGWSIGLLGRRAVLGQMTARIHDVARLGEHCVVVAECDRWEGRKAFSRSTVYGADERVLGVAAATWIELR
jgi:hypothetical protein